MEGIEVTFRRAARCPLISRTLPPRHAMSVFAGSSSQPAWRLLLLRARLHRTRALCSPQLSQVPRLARHPRNLTLTLTDPHPHPHRHRSPLTTHLSPSPSPDQTLATVPPPYRRLTAAVPPLHRRGSALESSSISLARVLARFDPSRGGVGVGGVTSLTAKTGRCDGDDHGKCDGDRPGGGPRAKRATPRSTCSPPPCPSYPRTPAYAAYHPVSTSASRGISPLQAWTLASFIILHKSDRLCSFRD